MLITSHNYYIDGYLKKNLDFTKEMVKKDFDSVWCVAGSCGAGKSTLAIQLAFYFDDTFTNERIVFTPEDFQKAIFNAEKYQAVIFDEAMTGLFSRSSVSHINKTIVQMLNEIRQKNLFVLIVLPAFHDLDKNIAVHRSKVLLYVYLVNGYERGYFAFYNEQKKKKLYILGKKFYSYSQPNPDFKGRFTGYIPIDETLYRKNKYNSLVNRDKLINSPLDNEDIKIKLFVNAQQYTDISHNIKAKILQMPESTYFYRLKQFNEGKLE